MTLVTIQCISVYYVYSTCIQLVFTYFHVLFLFFLSFKSEWVTGFDSPRNSKTQDKTSDYRKIQKGVQKGHESSSGFCTAHSCAQLCRPQSWIRPRPPELHAAAAALLGFGTLEELQMRPRRQRIEVPGRGQRMAPSPGPTCRTALQKPR